MTDPQKTVFISYRRSVSRYLSLLLFKDLTARGFDVFRDVESISSGEFEEIIFGQIAARAHFLVLMSHGTMDRCIKPDDWLRREIEYAVTLKRNIVPIWVDGFKLEDADQYLVSHELLKLKGYHAQLMVDEFYDNAVDQLVTRRLGKRIEIELQPVPANQQAEAEKIVSEAEQAPKPTKKELSAESYFIRAYVKQETGDLDGAITDYNEAIWLDPNNVYAYYNRGNARIDQKNYDGAIADYNVAIRLDPNNALAYNNRGLARASQKDYDGAISDCNEAIRLDPNITLAYNNRGLARASQKDYEGAIADYNEAIRRNPNDDYAYNNRGLARYEQKDYVGAIVDYNEAIRLNPKNATIYNNRGIAQAERKDYDGAISDYNAALHLNANYASAYNSRGELYFTLEKYSEASVDFQMSCRIDPLYKFARAGLAITQHALGNVKEAQKIWKELLQEDSQFKDVAWVQKELNWAQALADEAAKLIASLNR